MLKVRSSILKTASRKMVDRPAKSKFLLKLRSRGFQALSSSQQQSIGWDWVIRGTGWDKKKWWERKEDVCRISVVCFIFFIYYITLIRIRKCHSHSLLAYYIFSCKKGNKGFGQFLGFLSDIPFTVANPTSGWSSSSSSSNKALDMIKVFYQKSLIEVKEESQLVPSLSVG